MIRQKIEINNLSSSRIDRKFLKRVAKRALKFVKIKSEEISLVLVCDARMKNLNRKYRGRNRVTDVLSFDYGEIIICLSQARRQAKKIGHSLKKELGILLVHGILHLAGYNDKKPKDFQKMTKLQDKLIEK